MATRLRNLRPFPLKMKTRSRPSCRFTRPTATRSAQPPSLRTTRSIWPNASIFATRRGRSTLPGLSPEQQADLAFAWVCRQVYLNPWLINPGDRILAAALPPAYVLRRGSGSALERMYVFLALLQQMGLDGCLIGPPQTGRSRGISPVSLDQKSALPGARPGRSGPLACGFKGATIPKSSSIIPGAVKPSRFVRKLKANPESQKAWLENQITVPAVTTADVNSAMVFLAIPVNSLSPRMSISTKSWINRLTSPRHRPQGPPRSISPTPNDVLESAQ